MSDAIAGCREILAARSKSFRLASRLLPAGARDDAAVVYAFCRRADDAVDERPRAEQAAQVAALRAELDRVYARAAGVAAPLADPVLEAFADVIRRRRIPRFYPEELIEGMAMDERGERYVTLEDLYRYCFRVAGTVGLMMCHVMGVSRGEARVRAAHLGMAMQLTNICRDVAEDWDRGRVYLPTELLARAGAARLVDADTALLGVALPAEVRTRLVPVVKALLADAERFYRSGATGLAALGWRSAFAVDAARAIYRAIGDELRRRDHDVLAGRAFVTRARKLWLVAGCALRALASAPARLFRLLRGASSETPALAAPGWSDDFLRP